MFIVSDNNVGEFYLNETGKYFSFQKSTNEWGKSHGFEYEIDVLDGKRCANINKKFAYVVVDEDENGPVIEKWTIARLSMYTKN